MERTSHQLFGSRITGTGAAFPERSVSNAELAQELAQKGIETSNDWIVERTGIHHRRLAQFGNENEFNSALAARASRSALEMADCDPLEIDQIIFATCTGDTIIPSTACWLQKDLGARNAAAFDLNAACSGWLYALTVADKFIQSGFAKKCLVIGSENLSSITNWEDRGQCILFGDAAGAAVVERVEADDPRRILSTHIRADGRLTDILYIETGGSRKPDTAESIRNHQNRMTMLGREVYKEAVRTLTEYALTALDANKMTAGDLDWFIPHQANLRIIEGVAKRLQIAREKVLINLDRHGNTSSATLPTVLDEGIRSGKIKPGQTVLFDVFGSGLTYGSALIRI